MTKKAVIIGGGIGGLASAIALYQAGWQVRVLEQAHAFGEVGAGISLWPNSLHALDMLGVGDQARKIGSVEKTAGLRHKNGKWLVRGVFETIKEKYGQTILIHRADLIDILRNALPAKVLTLHAKVENVQYIDGKTVVTRTQGKDTCDLVVAADGIHSITRTTLWPEAKPPQYAGYTTWRFLTPPLQTEIEPSETWGNGERVGLLPFDDGSVYSYLTANVPPNQHAKNELIELKQRFGKWHEPIPTLLGSIKPDVILRNDVYHLITPLTTYVKGRVVLVGDAAHAMTPDLGQGGSTALEDAVELARALKGAPTIEAGLQQYDALRRPRTQAIVKQSAQIGAVSQWSWRPAVWLRNNIMRFVPASKIIRLVDPILSWDSIK